MLMNKSVIFTKWDFIKIHSININNITQFHEILTHGKQSRKKNFTTWLVLLWPFLMNVYNWRNDDDDDDDDDDDNDDDDNNNHYDVEVSKMT